MLHITLAEVIKVKGWITSASETQPQQALQVRNDPVRPSIEIRSLYNVMNRYLTATKPQEASDATGGNTHIIMYLKRHENHDIFQGDIERRFSITRSTASRVLSLMEKKGLIERQSVDYDARLRRIVLTEKAQALSEMLRNNALDMENVMTKGIAHEDLERMLDCIATMKANLRATGLVGEC